MEAMKLSQNLACVISQRWPNSLTLMMVGSFAMNTASQAMPIVDLLLIPEKQSKNQFEEFSSLYGTQTPLPQVPLYSELYEFFNSLSAASCPPSFNVKIEYDSVDHLLAEKGHIYSEELFPKANTVSFSKPSSDFMQSKSTPIKQNEWVNQIAVEDVPQLVYQADHEDSHSFVFTSPSCPDVKARIFVSTSIGNPATEKQMSRFNAGSLHASWIRLISGEEIQMSVMHVLFLIRLIR